MAEPVKVNLKIYQGATFTKVFRYELPIKEYRVIENIFTTAPLVIQSTAHGVPLGWRVKLSNIVGTTELNKDEYLIVTDKTADSITIGDVNAAGFKQYVSGGIIEFNRPKDLSTIVARMHIKTKVSATDTILELTTENGMLVVDDAVKQIKIEIPATVTEGLDFKSAVYSMELVEGSVVIPFLTGSVALETEVTK